MGNGRDVDYLFICIVYIFRHIGNKILIHVDRCTTQMRDSLEKEQEDGIRNKKTMYMYCRLSRRHRHDAFLRNWTLACEEILPSPLARRIPFHPDPFTQSGRIN